MIKLLDAKDVKPGDHIAVSLNLADDLCNAMIDVISAHMDKAEKGEDIDTTPCFLGIGSAVFCAATSLVTRAAKKMGLSDDDVRMALKSCAELGTKSAQIDEAQKAAAKARAARH